MCYTGERSGVLAGLFAIYKYLKHMDLKRQRYLTEVVVHHEEHVALQHPYVDVRYPAKKAHHLPVEGMAVAWG